MNLVPDEELRGKGGLNLAPMVDFLFLVVAVFATIAVTRATLFDSEINLVKVTQDIQQPQSKQVDELSVVNLAITASGQYKWITEFNEFWMESITAIDQELVKQQKMGLLPQDSNKTRILLHIDKKAQWEPVVELIFSLKKNGYQIHPVYEVDEAL